MKGKLRWALFIVACSAFSAQAQESKTLSLAEAINLGIKNSKQLRASSARIDEANAVLKQAEQRKLPDAGVSGSYLRLNSAHINVKSNNSGGSGSGSGNNGEAPKISQAVYGIVNASLPIYTGGRINYGIESSRLLAEAAKLDADNEKEDVISNIIEAYINLYKAKSAADLVNQNLVQAQQRVKDFRSLEKNGLLARNDLLKAELQASSTELTLLDVQNNWQLANINMDLLLGLPQSTELLPDSASVNSKLTVGSLDEYLQSALSNRKDIAAGELRKKASMTGVKAIQAEKYPSLAITGGYIAADIPKFITITNAVNIGVGVSYNLASLWKNKAKVDEATARAMEFSANQDLLSDRIRLQVNKSYLDWLSSQKKIDVNKKAIEQANENYRITKNKYDNSLATTTELLDAEVAQLQANLNYVFSKADAVLMYNRLLQSSGLLTGANLK